ncbi:hypothetical protein P175DRAFT_019690 [Aspergillus ochraceoroseus IBT 24754]|uniref:Uncharacterized protein n=1 Tax=Aspergillus ochraceoroseus IBT 24754 TaxID=1392256 RepID=A0A2T5M6D5_9EURO|nr:uncharacterized protein P175DRAFT_019690 [Aspergillus ochraceoroseus IBT 24754]PTU24095.1 hypothetical protein P175DRAFT_019690 [Aspergillus ochraceoroseus IBT 24754]
MYWLSMDIIETKRAPPPELSPVIQIMDESQIAQSSASNVFNLFAALNMPGGNGASPLVEFSLLRTNRISSEHFISTYRYRKLKTKVRTWLRQDRS